MSEPFSASYLAGAPAARPFFPHDFRDPQARLLVTRRSAGRPIAAALLADLRQQDRALAPSAARARHLDLLSAPGSTAVVSGQQVGLFLGPLYTFYKAATVIALARAITAETGAPCAPIFWLQTEDHDFAEIRDCLVPRPGDDPLRLQLQEGAIPIDARVSVAQRALGEDVLALHQQLAEALGSQPHAAELLGLLAAHYRPGQSLSAAFGGALAEIFAEEGLVVLDPRRPAIARLAAPLYRRALRDSQALCHALQERSQALRAAGFDEQVRVRPGSTLVFFHEGSASGPRYRLEPRPEGGFALAGSPRAVSAEEVQDLLDQDPLRFSSSALLRPLVQDALLPTVAYVGGPGEINYLAQLAPLYAGLGVPQPLVVPRARFRCLEDNTRALLGKLGLRSADAELPRAELLRRICARSKDDASGSEPPDEGALRADLLGDISARLVALESVDPGLREPARRARESIERTISKLAERYGKTLLERDTIAAERVDRLQGFLFPDRAPQERAFSLPSFACRHGLRAFKDRVLSAIDPASLLAPALRDLEL